MRITGLMLKDCVVLEVPGATKNCDRMIRLDNFHLVTIRPAMQEAFKKAMATDSMTEADVWDSILAHGLRSMGLYNSPGPG